jgi:hypothetical protein
VITKEQYLRFCDEALTAMRDIVVELGDDLANQRPQLAGANSPVQIVTHCLGVMGHWAGAVNLGRDVPRDRDAEFRARSSVVDLAEQVEEGRRQFHADVAGAEPWSPPTGGRDDLYTRGLGTQGAVLLHVYEELAQHRGHLDLTRDLLRGGGATGR